MWSSPTTVVPLTQGVDGPVETYKPGETSHVQIQRTGVVTDLLLVEVFGTLDLAGPRDEVPLYAFGMESGEDVISFILRGIWGSVIRIRNGEATPSGTVTANLRYRKDGVDVG